MLNVALIGVRGYAEEYLGYLLPMAENGLVNFAAVVRVPAQAPIDFERLKKLGTRIYNSVEEMFAAEQHLDLVAIPTSISSHYTLSRMAIEHGCNVQVEKPLCGSIQEAREFLALSETARAKGLFIAVGFQHSYAPEFHLAKQLLLNGCLGRPKRISVLGLWPRNDDYYSRNSWAARIKDSDGKPVYDSPASNAFAHYINIPLFLTGKQFAQTAMPKSISAAMFRARPEIKTFDSCAITLMTDEDTPIRIFLSHACRENRDPHIIVEAERGTFDWQVGGKWSVNVSQPQYNGELSGLIASGLAVKPHSGMLQNVFARVIDKNRFIYTPEMAFPHTCCIESMHKSTPIRILPSEFVTRLEDRKQYVVERIEEHFTNAFNGGNLFEKCPWAGSEPNFEKVRTAP